MIVSDSPIMDLVDNDHLARKFYLTLLEIPKGSIHKATCAPMIVVRTMTPQPIALPPDGIFLHRTRNFGHGNRLCRRASDY